MLFAGLSAGLLGIGGGLVQGPLMLEMGMLPQVQRATSATMVFFTSSSAAVLFLLAGKYPGGSRPEDQVVYAAWFALMGFIGTVAGQLVMKIVLAKYARPSVIVFTLASIIGASCVLMGVSGGFTIADELRTHEGLSFTALCPSA
jgi:uncharacterized membrane protein YfcA